jgi:sensor c-di-GMP phosphodiesterase-like protein
VTHARSSLVMVALLLAGAGIGLGIAGIVAHSLQLASGEEELQQYASRLLRGVEAVAREMRSADDAVLAAELPYCSDQELAFMRRIVFDSSTIKELGRDSDGKLDCTTTMGRLSPPLPMPAPDAEDHNVKFYALTPLAIAPGATGLVAELGGVSVVANPDAFKDAFDEPPMVSTGLFFARESGRTIYAFGHREPLSSTEVVAQHLVERDGIFYQPLCSKVYRVCAVAAEPRAAILAKGKAQSAMHLIGGALLGGCAALALILFYRRQRSLERRLRRALRTSRLTVAYQPVVDLNTRAVVGAEALARWTNESNEQVPADVFIELAERKGFIGEITRYVLQNAVEEMNDLLRGGNFHVMVNISMQDLNAPAFFNQLRQCVKAAKIAPAALNLELTERSTADREAATQAIARLKSMGHAVFIDDFGTGYSSLAYLHDLAVDGIKIDRAFTGTIGTQAVTASVVPQILGMARQLGLLVVVEGIETEEQAEYFRSIGRGILGQGWLYGKPVTAEQFRRQLRSSLTQADSSAYVIPRSS